jgi:anti-anti-sigma regulatory factor
MSADLESAADPRIAQILDLVLRITDSEPPAPGSTSTQHDAFERITAGLNRIAETMARQQELNAQAEHHGQEILAVMFAAAAQEYAKRAPVGDGDTLLDALSTGLNMLLDELVANQLVTMQLQEEIIRSQEAALRELSTPLIPIADEVVVMPLVGSLDSRRAQQVIETLLVGVAELRAQVAIVDITGVPVVDTQVANALVQAAQSVRLLGAEVVLTGIRPEVAQTLVGLGTDLQTIITRATLQSGIAFALRKDGR